MNNLEEKYRNLPSDLRRAISSEKVAERLNQIAKRHKVHFDRYNELFDEVGMVMLGETHPSNFVGNLVKKLEIDEGLARTIAQDINIEIFRPVRDSLKKIHDFQNGPDIRTNSNIPNTKKGAVDTQNREVGDKKEFPASSLQKEIDAIPKPATEDMDTLDAGGVHIEKSSVAPAAGDEPEHLQSFTIPKATEPETASASFNREQMLKEIENPSLVSGASIGFPKADPNVRMNPNDTNTKEEWRGSLSHMGGNLNTGGGIPSLEEKMKGMFKSPLEESRYKPADNKPEPSKQNGDPYREPIE